MYSLKQRDILLYFFFANSYIDGIVSSLYFQNTKVLEITLNNQAEKIAQHYQIPEKGNKINL